ncbi:MAG: desaturase [Myxococcaceae bacterium]|nr:desaturase [Myxococcaceae bacterium]
MTSSALARRASTPSRHVYDVIIFGSQLPGVLTAGVLAKRGLQVLLVEHDGLGSPYVHQDYMFSHAPFLLGPLEALGPLEGLLTELGALTQAKRLVHHAGLQVLRPRQWFELSAKLGARSKEVSRALGDEGGEALLQALDQAAHRHDATDAFFQSKPDLPADGWFARWKLRRHLARFSGLEADTTLSLQAPLEAMVRSLERFVVSADGPIARARALSRILPTPWTVPGGFEAFRGVLVDRARELGVDVVDSEQQIELLAFDGRTAVGLRLRKGDTTYRAGALVAACDLSTLALLIPDARKGPLEKLALRVPTRRALFTTHAVLPDRALPRGLGALGLIEGTDGELGPVLFEVTPARRANQDVGEKVLSFTIRAATQLRSAGEPAVQALVERVWASVADVFPFTRKHVTLQSSPWVDSARVVAGVAEPFPSFEPGPDSVLGLSGLTTASPWPRLYLASRQVLPGLGLEGEALAAQRAIAAVEKRLVSKKDPLKVGRPG